MKVDAILLAGAKNHGALRECSTLEYEALIEVNGVPMIDYVVEAARSAVSVERIIVVGPEEWLKPHLKDRVDYVVEGTDQIIENLSKAIEVLGKEKKVLIITSDIPMISSAAIDRFVAQCEDREVDFYYPIISKEANLQRFPGTQRTYARLREGTYTGGNIFVLNPVVIDQAEDFMNKLVTWRKKPLKLSQLFGVKFICKFVLGRLTITELEQRLKKITGCSAATLVCESPEIGFDIDKPSDLDLIEKFMGQAN